eukprot:CAMPEP_0183342924 /NCGR_PEP_ID=MMETSP0164_2-20130417/8942_1 /TAXON_ID=221442 /ORGANISM="Coccolithus pelagicus ssp braarudi, Strain PLY182g" /LENGTH=32 /DNA_ID= /DNA_START= /DNA_END= /DNA_ORIENTATION=
MRAAVLSYADKRGGDASYTAATSGLGGGRGGG